MAVNKVVYDGETLVDLTGDNVSESTLLSGATAHNAAGEAIVGTVVVPTIDSALSADSTNPVQNKVINTKFTSIQSDIDNKVPLSRTINGKALTTNITLTAADVGALPNTTVIPSIEGLATETYVNNKFASIVDSAPETLDTLKELSDALGNDPNFATTIATQIGGKVDKVSGKGLSSNDYTTNEKNKLAGIAAGAEVNQNTFSNVIIAGTTISAVNKQDSLTLVAGNNITLTPDANNKKITITSKDTVYTHPSYTSKSSGLYKITVDGTGHVSGTTMVTKSDITALGIPAQDTTYSEATTSAAGLMSATDKTKLNGIAEGAEKNVQSDLSQTDNTAKDYVKGVLRNEHLPEGYPYKEIGATILDGTFEFADVGSQYIHQITDENFTIVLGRSYIIIWDGVTYQCVATTFSDILILGNLAITGAGSDTGEPFLFAIQGTDKFTYTADTATSHTITIHEEITYPIAIEFLPESATAQADWNQNDNTQPDYVKNRTHYEESIYADYVLNMDGTEIVGLSIPEVGGTMTVKINGVESAETVKKGTSSPLGNYTYIGTIDFDSLLVGGTGWLVAGIPGQAFGFANPDTTITVETIIVHKIDDKFINFDGLVRTFDYHFKGGTIYKHLYKDDGSECALYTCNHFILPETGSQLFGFMGETGFSNVGSSRQSSCFVKGVMISGTDGSITIKNTVFGTNTTEMEQLAKDYGYTLTTKPNA